MRATSLSLIIDGICVTKLITMIGGPAGHAEGLLLICTNVSIFASTNPRRYLVMRLRFPRHNSHDTIVGKWSKWNVFWISETRTHISSHTMNYCLKTSVTHVQKATMHFGCRADGHLRVYTRSMVLCVCEFGVFFLPCVSSLNFCLRFVKQVTRCGRDATELNLCFVWSVRFIRVDGPV